ncbi:MAG: hypothetical protein US35_C0014G0014 [Parcubacteria group bacterium GW2011_GWA2_37_10]|nr:MAG: hypothetical protein US35_C0014G0014 [Parcubacteria group bacterium GW2011_GWA2_37_10]HLD38083.1 hypothetical protein [Candidatus Nanoarchaeia archaeon]
MGEISQHDENEPIEPIVPELERREITEKVRQVREEFSREIFADYLSICQKIIRRRKNIKIIRGVKTRKKIN